MPSYELNLVIKRIPKVELKELLKMVGSTVWEHDGILRKIEFLGHRQLPYSLPNSSNPNPTTRKRIKQGSFFIYHVDLAPESAKSVYRDLRLDPNILKAHTVEKKDLIPADYVCTLDDEMKPPAFRKSVQEMIEKGRHFKIEVDPTFLLA